MPCPWPGMVRFRHPGDAPDDLPDSPKSPGMFPPMFPTQFPIGVRDSLELPMSVGTESGTPCEARAHNADYSTTSRRMVDPAQN